MDCIIKLTIWSLPLIWGAITLLAAAVAVIAWQLAKIKRDLLRSYEIDCMIDSLEEAIKAIEEAEEEEEEADGHHNSSKPCEK